MTRTTGRTQRQPRLGRDERRKRRLALWFMLFMAPTLAFWSSPTARADEAAAKERKDAKADARAKGDPLDNEPAQWLRFVDDGKGGGKLEVATGTYKNEDGVTVRLVGAVHVGEKAYYDALNKDFEKYDALLYEMVKPANAGAPKAGAPSRSMVSMFQRFLKDVLELDFQLDDVDYTKANFVHADLDAETFAKMQEEKGESLMGLMLQQMVRQMARDFEGKGKQQQMDLFQLIEAFNSPDRARQFKMILGQSFGDLEEQMSGMQGTVLVTERNKKALAVLKDQVRAGKKNIGIFYGAAHLSDMENRLALMGFKRTGLEWRTAWDMTVKKDDKAGGAGKAEKEERD